MPVIHDKQKLEQLLKDNGIPLTDAVKRGKFYESYFDWDNIYKEYCKGKSIRDISKEINLSYDAIRANLKKRGELREFRNNSKGYSFEYSELFPNPSEYGAYLLGWLYSDGSITHNRISIIIQKKDYEHLRYLASLYCNKPISITSRGYSNFTYFDVTLCDRLMTEYNVLPNKSHINFEIPVNRFKKTLPYLLLGLLEGDGSIARDNPTCSLLLTEATWSNLNRTLQDLIDLSHIQIRQLNGYGLLNIEFRGLSYFSLLNYIYGNTELVEPLERKKERFIKQVERSMKGKTSPYKKLAVSIWCTLIHNTI